MKVSKHVTMPATVGDASAQQTPAQKPGQSPTQSPQQSPTQSAPKADPTIRVPKGQLDRIREHLPKGWFNEGGHGGFKHAVLRQAADGYLLDAANRADVPRGRR